MLVLKIYLIAINIVAFVTFGVDKIKAIRHHWRIPERKLMLLAILGGGGGALAAMLCFWHKTRHIKFAIGVPLIATAEYLALWLIFY